MKSKTRLRRGGALLKVAVSFFVLAGCGDNTVEPQQADPLQGLGPGIHPVLVLASQSGGAATVEVHLKRVQVSEKVASYQGELGFDTGLLTLSTAAIPQGVMGAWNEVDKGRVRFAGAALEGVPDGAVLTLRFQAKGAVTAEAFTLKMEEVIATADFQNLTSKVVEQERPRFSATPLR